jgi:hypothetical protein
MYAALTSLCFAVFHMILRGFRSLQGCRSCWNVQFGEYLLQERRFAVFNSLQTITTILLERRWTPPQVMPTISTETAHEKEIHKWIITKEWG